MGDLSQNIDKVVQTKELPDGIIRVGSAVLANERLMTPELMRACENLEHGCYISDQNGAGAQSNPTVQLAVFDFDGTSIRGSSPVVLVRELFRKDMLSNSVALRILLWGLAYELRLPQNESWVRGQVFSAFSGKPVGEVNAFLWQFYDEHIENRFHEQTEKLMEEHVQNGHVVVCLSATFEPIIAEAMCKHSIHFGIATRMHIDDQGCYTNQVEGLPTEGAEKVSVITDFGDTAFGAGGWEIGWAYGDHHSDRMLLAAAQHGFAVDPDRPLRRTAEKCGYEILDWDQK